MAYRLFYILIFISVFICCNEPKATTLSDLQNISIIDEISGLKIKSEEAFRFCNTNKLNVNYCILINAGLHSGRNRFFIWSFANDTFIKAFPVSHGCGNNNWNRDESKTNPCFSNIDGSHCSSLGKYKLGERGRSDWGIHVKYLLHGLDSSNSNALSRQIVFHSWESIPDIEVYPDGTPEGWGCPAISNKNMFFVDSLLKQQKAPLLMWIYQ